jgi:hypothetical protein
MDTNETTEKLTKIRAKCAALLETAKHRTPGKWRVESSYIGNGSAARISAGINEYGDGPAAYPIGRLAENELKEPDAAFITACAGSAEAGWKATIAMIDCTLLILGCLEGCENQSRELETANHFAFEIIAAWEVLHP